MNGLLKALVFPICVVLGTAIVFPVFQYCLAAYFGGTEGTWSIRGQFGDSFGALNALLAFFNLALIAYSFYQQGRATRRFTEENRWIQNYEYLKEAKMLIASNPELLALHGIELKRDEVGRILLPLTESGDTIAVTAAEVAYVLLDIKAADLYYRISGLGIKPTDYRVNLFSSPRYRTIVREVIVKGKLIPDGEFRALLDRRVIPCEAASRNLGCRSS